MPAQLWSDATKPGGMDLDSGLTSSSLAFLGIAQDRVMLSTAARYSIKRCKRWMAQGTSNIIFVVTHGNRHRIHADPCAPFDNGGTIPNILLHPGAPGLDGSKLAVTIVLCGIDRARRIRG